MPDWPEAFFGGSKTDCRGTAGRDWVYTGSSSSGTVPGGGTRGWKSGEAIFGGRRAAGSESRVSVWAYLGSGSGRAGDSSDVRNRGMGADVPVWKQHRVSRSGNAAKDAGTVSGRIGTGD